MIESDYENSTSPNTSPRSTEERQLQLFNATEHYDLLLLHGCEHFAPFFPSSGHFSHLLTTRPRPISPRPQRDRRMAAKVCARR
jgi:hypothetical protein